MTASFTRQSLSVAATVLALAVAAPAGAQYTTTAASYPPYSEYARQCMALSPAADQVNACMAALTYEPGNPELLRRMGDGLLASNRPGSAFDAFDAALTLRPDYANARAGRDEALRQVNARAGVAPTAAVLVPAPVVTTPVYTQYAMAPQVGAVPVAVGPFDGRWSGRIEPRGRSYSVSTNIVGGQLRIYFEDTQDRVTMEGTVDNNGYFTGKGFVKDKNKSAGDGGEPLDIHGRFTSETFEGTGSTGSKFTEMRLNRDHPG